MRLLFFSGVLLFALSSWSQNNIAGFNLTENGRFLFDANPEGAAKTDAQLAVDSAKTLGTNHIIINVRATMSGPYSSEVIPTTPPAERSKEALRILRLIKYVKSQGMSVGIRPIFFVVGPHGEFPYVEKLPDGTHKAWWHGNIQPNDPNRWFESFRVFLDVYLTIAKQAKVDEFTLGAELYSMTVGIEDQWRKYPYGFPGRWLELLHYVREKLPAARIMYDINFTDASTSSNGFASSGGELERWRYRLVDLADRTDPAERKIWQDLAAFWNELDYVGLDVYRSLASKDQVLPTRSEDIIAVLKSRADSYASQLDTTLLQIELTLNRHKDLIIKEIGFRSVENGFVDPFTYAGSGKINIEHQALAYEAIFQSFWDPQWPWFKGINFWDVSIDPSKAGSLDNGFSPLGKPATEAVIRSRYIHNFK